MKLDSQYPYARGKIVDKVKVFDDDDLVQEFSIVENHITLDEIRKDDRFGYLYKKVEIDSNGNKIAVQLSNQISEIKGSQMTRKADIGDINIDRYIQQAVLPLYVKSKPDYFKIYDKTIESNDLKIIILVDTTGSTLGSDTIHTKNRDFNNLNEFFRYLCLIINKALKPHKSYIDYEFWSFCANSNIYTDQYLIFINKIKNPNEDSINEIFPIYNIRVGVHHGVVLNLIKELRKEQDKKTLFIFLTDGYPEYSGFSNLIQELGKSLVLSYNSNIDFYLFLALTEYYNKQKAEQVKDALVKISRNRIYYNEIGRAHV